MSGRIRTIKPEWRFDEKLQGCSDEARVLSVCLLTLSDDWGCGRASPGYLAGECWGQEMAREDGARASAVLAKVSRALRELRGVDFVSTYEVGGQTYFHVTKWETHQRVDNRAKNRRIPAPPLEKPETSRDSSETLATHSRGSPLDLDLGSGPGSGPGARATVVELELALTRNSPKPQTASEHAAMASEMCRAFKRLTGRAWTSEEDLLEALAGRGALARTPMPEQVRAMSAHFSEEAEPVKAARRAMEAWAADPWVQKNRYPMAHLAKDPLKYLSKPVLPNPSAPSDFSHVDENEDLDFL